MVVFLHACSAIALRDPAAVSLTGDVAGEEGGGGASETATDTACGAEISNWDPTVHWSSAQPSPIASTPVVGDLDDDDTPEVVVAALDGTVLALSGADGRVLWQVDGLGGQPSTPALGDVDGDGRLDVVGSGPHGIVALRGSDGSLLWSQLDAATSALALACGGPGIYDLDGDRRPEIVQGNRIYDGATGELRATGEWGVGSGYTTFGGSVATLMGVAGDIDGDGTLEVVVGNALYDSAGSTLWSNGESDGYVSLANFDADLGLEIVVSGEGGFVRLQDGDGVVLWTEPFPSGAGPSAVADFDGDPGLEIAVAGADRVQVRDGDGELVWEDLAVDAPLGVPGVSAFDFDADGRAELALVDRDGLRVLDGRTGSVRLEYAAPATARCTEYPTIADVDGDGHADIVIASGDAAAAAVVVLGAPEWARAGFDWDRHGFADGTGFRLGRGDCGAP